MKYARKPICVGCQWRQMDGLHWVPMAPVYTCAICHFDICARHARPLRLWAGMSCEACVPIRPCEPCARHAQDDPAWHVRRARNTCLYCQRPVCGVHTHWFHGHVSCGCCAHSPARVEEPRP